MILDHLLQDECLWVHMQAKTAESCLMWKHIYTESESVRFKSTGTSDMNQFQGKPWRF